MTDPSGTASEPRVAIVTGSDSGIGRATAVALAQAGLDVGITWVQDHEEEQAASTAEEVRSHGRRAEVARLDAGHLESAAGVLDGRPATTQGDLEVWNSTWSSAQRR